MSFYTFLQILGLYSSFSGYRLLAILLSIGCGLLFIINLILYYRWQQSGLIHKEATEAKNYIKEEKQQVESELKLSCEQTETQKELLFRYDLLLKFRIEQQIQMHKNANKIRSKYPLLGDAYDKMMNTERDRFNKLIDRLFTMEDLQRMFGINDENGILTKNDRLLLFMLANDADNDQIAAFLSISSDNLKSRKSYLKKKIVSNVTNSNGFQRLTALFRG